MNDLATTIADALRRAALTARMQPSSWFTAPETNETLEPGALAAMIVADEPWRERPPQYLLPARASVIATWESFVARPDVTLVHAVRLLALTRRSALDTNFFARTVLMRWSEEHGAIDLHALLQTLSEQHIEDDEHAMLAVHSGSMFTIESLAHYFDEHADRVESMIELLGGPWQRDQRRALLLRVLAAGPVTDRLATALIPYALRASRAVAPGIRRALRGVDTSRIAAILSSRDKSEREHAADWLGERRDPTAVPALLAALKKEKTDAVRAALLNAIEACGAEAPIDLATLESEAKKLLAKGWPGALGFLEPSTLPTLRWKDGAEVPSTIVAGWFVAAYKAKDLGASALVRTLAARMEPGGPRSFARAVLDRFIAWDTRVPTDLTDGEKEIVEHALANWNLGKTVEELLSRPDAKNYGLPTRSAVSEKGVLGIVSSLGGGELVPTIEAYVRTHRGFRPSQSRAMLAVLAAIDDPRATQALLRFASRFRTPGIQKEAKLLADELAASRGWTVADLADRTVPTGGLDDDGSLTLRYGRRRTGEVIEDDGDETIDVTRIFVARLDDSDELSLRDDTGRVVKKLPDARADEDDAVVEREKKRFAAARKDLKALVASQRDRLYEAMLGERRWPVGDFRRYMLDHPVLGRLVRRTILTAHVNGQLVASFRPAGDGTFVSATNETVDIDASAMIGLLHSSLVTRELDAAWGEHLADYEIVPLFLQLGRDPAPKEYVKSGRIEFDTPREVLAVKVRSRAKSAGYAEQRGDGGYIEAYVKSLTTIGRSLVLEIEGIGPAVDVNEKATVRGISFAEGGDTVGFGAPASVQVGAVLRDEAWNELLGIVS